MRKSSTTRQRWPRIGFSLLMMLLTAALIAGLALSSGAHHPLSALAQDGDSVIGAEDVNDLGPLTILEQHTGSISEKAFSPDGHAFLTAGFDQQLCIWNVDRLGQIAGRVRFCINRYQPGVTQFAWSANGFQLAVYWGDAQTVDIYNVQRTFPIDEWVSIEPAARLPINDLPLLAVMFVGDGSHLLTTDLDGVVRLYSIPLRTKLFERWVAEIITAPEHPNLLFLLDEDGPIHILDVNLAAVIGQLETTALDGIVSPDGHWLLTWNNEETLLWPLDALDEDEALEPIELDTMAEGGQFGIERSLLATWEGQDVTIWDLDTLEVAGMMPEHRGGVSRVVFNGDASRALSVNTQGTARLWEFDANNTPLLTRWLDGDVDGIAFSPDGMSMVLTREDFLARFINFETGRLRGSYPLTTQMVFSPDWRIVADLEGALVIWHGLNGENRVFDWEPIGRANGLVNVRPTASQNQPRIAAYNPNTLIFARGRNPDGNWLYVQMLDGTQGWVQRQFIRLAEEAEVDALPIVEPAETAPTPEDTDDNASG